jgi:hypothetical protein
MKTIQTKPDCTLGFLPWEKGKSTKGLLILHDNFLYSRKYIGQLSEITEEQARELVEAILWKESISITSRTSPETKRTFLYKKYGNLPFIAPYHADMEGGEIHPLIAIHSLQSAALSVGIEEKDFDKYLVIKL